MAAVRYAPLGHPLNQLTRTRLVNDALQRWAQVAGAERAEDCAEYALQRVVRHLGVSG